MNNCTNSLTIKVLKQLFILEQITENEFNHANQIWLETDHLSNDQHKRIVEFKNKMIEKIGIPRTNIIIIMLHHNSHIIKKRIEQNKNNNDENNKTLPDEISDQLIDKAINYLVTNNRLSNEESYICKKNWNLTKNLCHINNYDEIVNRIKKFTIHNKYQLNQELSYRVQHFVLSTFNVFFEQYSKLIQA